MSLRFHWFLPTNGDGRDIVGGGHGVATGAAGAIRPPSVGYLGQIARSAEQLGFEGALTPTGAWCEDAWLTCAMLTEVTERLKFLVAFRPSATPSPCQFSGLPAASVLQCQELKRSVPWQRSCPMAASVGPRPHLGRDRPV